MTKQKEKFAGLTFNLLRIDATKFSGYGFLIFSITINKIRGITLGKTHTLLSFNVRLSKADEGQVWQYKFNLFFVPFKFEKVLVKPKTYLICHCCGASYTKDFHNYNGKKLCSYDCYDEQKHYEENIIKERES